MGGTPPWGGFDRARGAAPPVPGRVLPAPGVPGAVRVCDAPFHGSHRAVFGKDWGLPWGAPDLLWEGRGLPWEARGLSWQALYLSCAPMGPDQGSALPVLYTPGALYGKAWDLPRKGQEAPGSARKGQEGQEGPGRARKGQEGDEGRGTSAALGAVTARSSHRNPSVVHSVASWDYSGQTWVACHSKPTAGEGLEVRWVDPRLPR